MGGRHRPAGVPRADAAASRPPAPSSVAIESVVTRGDRLVRGRIGSASITCTDVCIVQRSRAHSGPDRWIVPKSQCTTYERLSRWRTRTYTAVCISRVLFFLGRHGRGTKGPHLNEFPLMPVMERLVQSSVTGSTGLQQRKGEKHKTVYYMRKRGLHWSASLRMCRGNRHRHSLDAEWHSISRC